MTYLENYKKRSQKNGVTQKDKMVNELKRNFLKQVKESPSGYMVKATRPDEITITENSKTIACLINNVTLNDQRVLDEKYLHVACDEDIEIGCYIYWQNAYWLLMFMEHNSIESHRTFTIRRCNQIIKHRHDGQIWEIPVSIENLTMYSDGLADLKMTSQSDSKRHLSYGTNPVTREIKIGQRVMLGRETVFRITHINDFEYNSKYTGSEGLIKALVLSCSLIEGDDVENRIAYNEVDETPVDNDGKIKGDTVVSLGSVSYYNTGTDKCGFELQLLNNKYNYASLTGIDEYNCKIKISTDSRFIGQKMILKAYKWGTNTLVDSMEIKIIGV